jgi:hypothetical protein
MGSRLLRSLASASVPGRDDSFENNADLNLSDDTLFVAMSTGLKITRKIYGIIVETAST